MGILAQFVSIEHPSADNVVRLWNIIKRDASADVVVNDVLTMRDPDGFPYAALVISPNSTGKRDFLDREELYKLTVLEGRGIAICSTAEPHRPLWSFRYQIVLSLALFGTPKPPIDRYPTLSPQTHFPGASGTKIALASADMLPDYARKVVNERIGAVIGQKIDIKFETVELVDSSLPIAIKIELGSKAPSKEMQDAIGREVVWCIPYMTFVGKGRDQQS